MEDTTLVSGEFAQCKRCTEWKFSPEFCSCKRFECAEPFQDKVHDNDWHEVYAYDAEAAAEKCAEEFDCTGDYTMIRHGSGELWTRDEDGKIEKWYIVAESVPEYSAYIKK